MSITEHHKPANPRPKNRHQQANLFDRQKAHVLGSLSSSDGGSVEFDNSRKGSVDSLLVDFLSGLNAHPDYFSLSSCSGRICLVGNTAAGASDDQTDKVRKKGCSWLHIAHNQVSTDVIWEALNNQASERLFVNTLCDLTVLQEGYF